MRFDVLGPLRLSGGDHESMVTGTLRRNLLALLLVRANRPVPASVLTDALWGADGDDVSVRLYTQVHRLRALLDDPGRISSDESGYALRIGPGESDAARFEELARSATDAAPGKAVALLREALRLWRGPAYAGIGQLEVAEEAARLEERRVDVLEALYTAELDDGRHAEIAGELGEAARQHPLRERMQVLLMAALHRSGRQADALAAYRHAREVLVDELGLDPGPELREAERAVLEGRPIGTGGRAATPPVDLEPEPDPEPGIPAQLPHAPAGFVGRTAHLSALGGMLREASPVLLTAVVGGGGVGKTALAMTWAHLVKDEFPDGQLYADLRGYGPDRATQATEVLAAFLRGIGVEGNSIPEDPDERAARFRTLVDGRRMLIVLDNARSAEHVRPLLPGSATCRVVVTSRDALSGLVTKEGAHRINLDRMNPSEATHLLTSLVGERPEPEPEAMAELAARCAGVPLALRIAAERLRDAPHRRVADLVADLSDDGARLDVLDGGDEDTSLRAVFDASYSHLSAEAGRLLRLFGIHPGRDCDLGAIAALAGLPLSTTRQLVRALTRANLVEESGPRRYGLHDLLWTYSAELAETVDPPEEHEAALGRLLDHYLAEAARASTIIFPEETVHSGDVGKSLPAYADGMRWLDSERANLLSAGDVAVDIGRPDYVIALSRILTWYLDVAGYLDDARALHERALDLARSTDDVVAEGTALRGIGLVHFRARRYAESTRLTERALAMHQDAGATTQAATTLNCLGVLYGFSGRTAESERAFVRAIDLYHEIDPSWLMAYRPLTSLGLLHRRRGNLEEAERLLHEAYARTVDAGLLVGQAHAAYGLAGLHRDKGRLGTALEFARRAESLAGEAGFRLLQGLSRVRLGSIYARLRDFAEAHRVYQRALAVGVAIGSRQLQAQALNGDAETYATEQLDARAAAAFRESLAITGYRGAEYERARAHAGLGAVCANHGDDAGAVEHWQEAYDLFRGLGAVEADPAQTELAAAVSRSERTIASGSSAE